MNFVRHINNLSPVAKKLKICTTWLIIQNKGDIIIIYLQNNKIKYCDWYGSIDLKIGAIYKDNNATRASKDIAYLSGELFSYCLRDTLISNKSQIFQSEIYESLSYLIKKKVLFTDSFEQRRKSWYMNLI